MTAEDKSGLYIRRQRYTHLLYNEAYPDEGPGFTVKRYLKSMCRCTKKRAISGIFSVVPILKVLKTYHPRQYLWGDIIGGLSAAFLHLPQGLGFGLLASLSPITGIYTSFFPVVFYMLFGTSPHTSFGTNALIALMTAGIVDREAETRYGGNLTSIPEAEVLEYKIGVAMTASLLSGLILLAMGIFRLGFITTYFSMSFIGGFTTASAFHILASQIPKMLNIKVKAYAGAGKLVLTFIAIFKNITKSNPADIIITVISIIVLLAVKIGINERFAKKMKLPVPIDLILVITGTVVSHFAELHRRFGVSVIGGVPTGMPVPQFPDLEVLPRIGTDSFVLAVIILATAIAMAKLMARLHDYEINPSQELIAYGMCNFGSSFFRCFPSTTAPPRTMILSSLGARTTLNGIPIVIFILVTVMAAGQLFVSLPIAVLAAIIVVAIRNLILQVKQVPQIWRQSKPDFAIWLSTCLVGTFADLEYGVMVGVGVSFLTVIIYTQIASGDVMNIAENEDILVRKGRASPKSRVRVFLFNSILYFANAEKFKNEIFEKVLHPGSVVSKIVEQEDENQNRTGGGKITAKCCSEISHIIIDCSRITYIDIAGVNCLVVVVGKYKKVDTEIYLASVGDYMWKILETSGFFDIVPKERVFFDVWDAMVAAEGDSRLGSKITVTKF